MPVQAARTVNAANQWTTPIKLIGWFTVTVRRADGHAVAGGAVRAATGRGGRRHRHRSGDDERAAFHVSGRTSISIFERRSNIRRCAAIGHQP